jgi:hypothetical protein
MTFADLTPHEDYFSADNSNVGFIARITRAIEYAAIGYQQIQFVGH